MCLCLQTTTLHISLPPTPAQPPSLTLPRTRALQAHSFAALLDTNTGSESATATAGLEGAGRAVDEGGGGGGGGRSGGEAWLPIMEYREEILEQLDRRGVVVVVGETGCGKSTQLPQFLLDATLSSAAADGRGAEWRGGGGGLWRKGGGMIGCTQPRRVAAVSVARCVCPWCGWVMVGIVVGCCWRWWCEDCGCYGWCSCYE